MTILPANPVSIPFGSGRLVNKDGYAPYIRKAVSIPFGSGRLVNPSRRPNVGLARMRLNPFWFRAVGERPCSRLQPS